jgi:hypothetical protein
MLRGGVLGFGLQLPTVPFLHDPKFFLDDSLPDLRLMLLQSVL